MMDDDVCVAFFFDRLGLPDQMEDRVPWVRERLAEIGVTAHIGPTAGDGWHGLPTMWCEWAGERVEVELTQHHEVRVLLLLIKHRHFRTRSAGERGSRPGNDSDISYLTAFRETAGRWDPVYACFDLAPYLVPDEELSEAVEMVVWHDLEGLVMRGSGLMYVDSIRARDVAGLPARHRPLDAGPAGSGRLLVGGESIDRWWMP